MFSCEFCETFKNNLFTEHLWATASTYFLARATQSATTLTQEDLYHMENNCSILGQPSSTNAVTSSQITTQVRNIEYCQTCITLFHKKQKTLTISEKQDSIYHLIKQMCIFNISYINETLDTGRKLNVHNRTSRISS